MCKSRFVWAVAAVVVLTASVAAQERESPSPYFDCPYINYFDGDCPQLERIKPRMEPPAEDEQEAPAGSDDPDAQQDWLQEVPDELLPLFPRESPGSGYARPLPAAAPQADAPQRATLRALVFEAHEPDQGSPGPDRGCGPGISGRNGLGVDALWTTGYSRK